MINERLTHEELESLSLAMKSHFEVMAESGSEAESIECSQIVRALRELLERRKQSDELTMLVKQLGYSLKSAKPGSKLPGDAMAYLSAKGLISVEDILR